MVDASTLRQTGPVATRYLSMNLDPEQQIAVQCVVTTGGQPYAAGRCMVSRWTTRELQKCFQHGFSGSDGCFGDNNELVGKTGGRTYVRSNRRRSQFGSCTILPRYSAAERYASFVANQPLSAYAEAVRAAARIVT